MNTAITLTNSPVSIPVIPPVNNQIQETNKGTGAGGANTNLYGKKFEEKTNNQNRLLEQGFTKSSFTKNPKKSYDYYLSKQEPTKNTVFVLQNGLKMYMKKKYSIELFRCPDEAYIIEPTDTTQKTVIKILEKKEQKVEGSVETKLWSGPSLKREYEIVLGDKFEVHYAFCVSEFLKKKLISNEKKYQVLNQILKENNIVVLFGDDENYFETLDLWIQNESKICPYCKEEMVHGIQNEVMSRIFVKGGKTYSTEVKYEQLGWSCNMRDDNCDVIFDDNNTGENKKKYNDACLKLDLLTNDLKNSL